MSRGRSLLRVLPVEATEVLLPLSVSAVNLPEGELAFYPCGELLGALTVFVTWVSSRLS